MQDWIDAFERKPEKSGEYIVSVRFFRRSKHRPDWNGEHYYTTSGRYDAKENVWIFKDWFDDEEDVDADSPIKIFDAESVESDDETYRYEIGITGWMPMPEPYRRNGAAT